MSVGFIVVVWKGRQCLEQLGGLCLNPREVLGLEATPHENAGAITPGEEDPGAVEVDVDLRVPGGGDLHQVQAAGHDLAVRVLGQVLGEEPLGNRSHPQHVVAEARRDLEVPKPVCPNAHLCGGNSLAQETGRHNGLSHRSTPVEPRPGDRPR